MSWGVYSQDEEREDDLGDVTDAFQTNFFEALKQKGIENYELALNALDRAQNESEGKPEQLAAVYFERGKNLAALKRYDEALNMQESLLADYYSTNDEDGFVSEEIGECLLALNQPDEAKHHFKEAYRLLKDISWISEERLERMKQFAD